MKNQFDNGPFILQEIKNALEADEYKPEKQIIQGQPVVDENNVWHYGLRYQLPASVIMAGITETLVELDTVIIKFDLK